MTTSKRKPTKPKVTAKHRDSRPTIYHEYWVDRICSHLERGWSLMRFCENVKNPGMQTVMRWLKDPANEDFREKYARAREESAHADADHIGGLAEKAALGLIDPQAARVAIDARKWLAGKRKPKVYGDKIEHSGQVDGVIRVSFLAADEKIM